MKNFKSIYDLRNHIKTLDCYKDFCPIQKKLLLKRKNLQSIENGINIIEHLGFLFLENKTSFSTLNKIIIKEIKND